MRDRHYGLPERRLGESDYDWCQRAADSIPPDEIIKALIYYLDRRKKSRGEAWSFIGQILGHGSGVSAAIARKYRDKQPGSQQENQ